MHAPLLVTKLVSQTDEEQKEIALKGTKWSQLSHKHKEVETEYQESEEGQLINEPAQCIRQLPATGSTEKSSVRPPIVHGSAILESATEL